MEIVSEKITKMEIGEVYLSRLSDSSGRTYFIENIRETPSAGKWVVNFKDIHSEMKATYPKEQVQDWIDEGRLIYQGEKY